MLSPKRKQKSIVCIKKNIKKILKKTTGGGAILMSCKLHLLLIRVAPHSWIPLRGPGDQLSPPLFENVGWTPLGQTFSRTQAKLQLKCPISILKRDSDWTPLSQSSLCIKIQAVWGFAPRDDSMPSNRLLNIVLTRKSCRLQRGCWLTYLLVSISVFVFFHPYLML